MDLQEDIRKSTWFSPAAWCFRMTIALAAFPAVVWAKSTDVLRSTATCIDTGSVGITLYRAFVNPTGLSSFDAEAFTIGQRVERLVLCRIMSTLVDGIKVQLGRILMSNATVGKLQKSCRSSQAEVDEEHGSVWILGCGFYPLSEIDSPVNIYTYLRLSFLHMIIYPNKDLPDGEMEPCLVKESHVCSVIYDVQP